MIAVTCLPVLTHEMIMSYLDTYHSTLRFCPVIFNRSVNENVNNYCADGETVIQQWRGTANE